MDTESAGIITSGFELIEVWEPLIYHNNDISVSVFLKLFQANVENLSVLSHRKKQLFWLKIKKIMDKELALE